MKKNVFKLVFNLKVLVIGNKFDLAGNIRKTFHVVMS